MRNLTIVMLLCMLLLGSHQSFAAPIFNSTTNYWYDIVPGSTWLQAESNSQALGGHLVTIHSASEEAWLVSNFGRTVYWIGLNDVAAENTWVWSSGEVLDYSNWLPGEPNNTPPGEDWVVMNWPTSSIYGWNDMPLSHDAVSLGIAKYRGGVIPEPASIVLLSIGLLGAGVIRRRKN